MSLLILLLACAGSAPEPVASADAEGAEHSEGADYAERSEHSEHSEHMTEHLGSDHATVRHRFDDVERWVSVFDDPERDAWQMPAQVVEWVALEEGQSVADVGAGTGYFNPHLAAAVGEGGRVIAIDVEENLVAHMAERAAQEGTPQVEARLGAYDDPKIAEGEVDRVLLVDTYHHIDGRVDYFRRLRSSLREGGLLVVVDFDPGVECGQGPPASHRIAADTVTAELESAGWSLRSARAAGDGGAEPQLPCQYALIFSPAG